MDGSRFDFELQQEGDAPAMADARGGEISELASELQDRPGLPMAAWAPVLIWTTLGATVAISVAL